MDDETFVLPVVVRHEVMQILVEDRVATDPTGPAVQGALKGVDAELEARLFLHPGTGAILSGWLPDAAEVEASHRGGVDGEVAELVVLHEIEVLVGVSDDGETMAQQKFLGGVDGFLHGLVLG